MLTGGLVVHQLLGVHLTAYQNPPEGTLGYVTCALAANSTKRRKKMGSSVAYKTIGTFLSQNKRRRCLWVGHRDAKQWVCSGTPVADAMLYPLDL